ncbi:HSP20 family protein [Neolewinella xylanilytica]|uniref:HSP20 family protein n=1 Tax=Neolewinella xylanilytica TaxID=1514080 RepID=A0A2S6I3V8_9BACT|nr:Hsp20/alpha crystallin family protein [Neolewinella xylanilytica]PPK85845.1 HSP20 family protein [Neolewinella xylanilytica]
MKLTRYNRFPASFRFFDDALTQAVHPSRPAVNILEKEDRFELEMVAPGRQKDLFKVDFFDGLLEVSYTTEKNGTEDQPTYLRHEFSLQDFTRKFKLNSEVIDDQAIEATYVDGILRLSLPKRENVQKPVRQITVA